jgi:hypothetical protein
VLSSASIKISAILRRADVTRHWPLAQDVRNSTASLSAAFFSIVARAPELGIAAEKICTVADARLHC